MELQIILDWIEKTGDADERAKLTRYGIPTENAVGIPMGVMRKYSKDLGAQHSIALELWRTGNYEARTLAVHLADPKQFTRQQANGWIDEFDSWAICDTACMHLFDKTPFAWEMAYDLHLATKLYTKRTAFALVWALSVHDKSANDAAFNNSFLWMRAALPDDRPHVNKAINMALRAVGKRNKSLNNAAIELAREFSKSGKKSTAWVGRHAFKELASEKLQARLAKRS